MKRTAAVISLALSVLMASETLVSEAYAQASQPEIVVAQENRGVSNFFRRLFRRREAPPPQPGAAPAPPVFELFGGERPARRERRALTAAPAQRQPAAVEKAADAKRVLVVGDFFASALAKGLAIAYEENPNVLVIDATNGSSGLVRKDFFDWPGKLPAIISEREPDAILVLVGGNDRQGIETETGPHALGTDGWRAAYAARVGALADAVKATAKPALWVGLMAVQSSTMSRDYSAFNGIVREQLETKGISFVDIWNGFADADGKYVAIGPDIRGQAVQLRASDGLNFTRAGQRKLAYFVEQELADIFGGIAPQLAATDPSAALKPGEEGPQIGPMVPLDALGAAGSETLATGVGGKDEEEDVGGDATAEIAKRLAGEEAPPPGRVDFYKWPPPPRPQPAAAAPAPAASAPAAAATPAPAQ
ncbi:MAG: SGNH/GDSL hydrolase family protein [Propylenella sp.]